MDDVIQHDPNYRDAQLERLTVLYRTCTIQRQSGARTASFATVELALATPMPSSRVSPTISTSLSTPSFSPWPAPASVS